MIVIAGQHLGFLAVAMVVGPLVSIALSLVGYWGNWRVSARSDWAPLNDTAAQIAVLARRAEGKGREVGRRFEPARIRSWRHRQMEKALQRRIEAEVDRGVSRSDAEANAEEFLEEFNADFPADSPVRAAQHNSATEDSEGSNFGVDISGDSYDDYGEDTALRQREYRQMLDQILADDEATDLLVAKLMKKYGERE